MKKKIRSKPKITELWMISNNIERGYTHIFKGSGRVNMSFFDRLLYPASCFLPEHTGKLC